MRLVGSQSCSELQWVAGRTQVGCIFMLIKQRAPESLEAQQSITIYYSLNIHFVPDTRPYICLLIFVIILKMKVLGT